MVHVPSSLLAVVSLLYLTSLVTAYPVPNAPQSDILLSVRAVDAVPISALSLTSRGGDAEGEASDDEEEADLPAGSEDASETGLPDTGESPEDNLPPSDTSIATATGSVPTATGECAPASTITVTVTATGAGASATATASGAASASEGAPNATATATGTGASTAEPTATGTEAGATASASGTDASATATATGTEADAESTCTDTPTGTDIAEPTLPTDAIPEGGAGEV